MNEKEGYNKWPAEFFLTDIKSWFLLNCTSNSWEKIIQSRVLWDMVCKYKKKKK